LKEYSLDSQTAVAAARRGRAYAFTGRCDEACALFNRYVTAAKERGDPLDAVRVTVLLANTQIDRCEYGAAETILSGILDQARDATDPTDRAFIYWTQSRLHSSQGEPEVAGRYARLALTTLEQTEHTSYVANAFLLLATLENDQGHSPEAMELVERAEPVVRTAGNRYDLGRLELERARAEVRTAQRVDVCAFVRFLMHGAGQHVGSAIEIDACVGPHVAEVVEGGGVLGVVLEDVQEHALGGGVIAGALVRRAELELQLEIIAFRLHCVVDQ